MRIRSRQSVEFRLAGFLKSAVNGGCNVIVYSIGIKMILKTAFFVALGGTFSALFDMVWWKVIGGLFGVYLVTGGWRFVRVILLTLPRDTIGLINLVKVLYYTRKYEREKTTIPVLFDKTADRLKDKPCILFKDEVWTFGEIQTYAHRVANFFASKGYQNGDVVAIFTENCPQYMPLWLGMARIGVVPALLNFNLTDISLAHCIKVSGAKAVIFAGNLSKAIQNVHSSLPSNMTYFSLGEGDSPDFVCSNFDVLLRQTSPEASTLVVRSPKEALFYIFTSGTTGMPKAAIVSHLRYFFMGYGIKLFYKLTDTDTLYIPLPLYHSAGGMLGTAQAVLGGTTLAVRPKFSASQFWTDCIKHNCTAGQYIGEICRYLLAQPVRPEETKHKVRVVFGNGIKPQIWKAFQERFKIPLIGEFYGATEGNCNTINFENKIGAVGFTTRILPALYPITLVKVDPSSGEIVRDRNGVCVLSQPGEPGELVGKIVKGNAARTFDGYVDGTATDKKIIHDVFKKGDKAFSTGDILVMDELGYMYFRDRTGDTFRWRGENVSTSEVEAVISNAIKLSDAVVYGVEVPGSEGRAGMAAIVDENNSIDMEYLSDAFSRSLPTYARPLFVRFIKEADTTGTFKLKKTTLRDEGFNVKSIKDRMFFLNPTSRKYEPLTEETYTSIIEQRVRL